MSQRYAICLPLFHHELEVHNLFACCIMSQRYAIRLPLFHHESEVRDLFASVAS